MSMCKLPSTVFTPKLPTVAGGQRKDPRTESKPVTWVVGIQLRKPWLSARVSVGRKLESGAGN